MAAVSRSSPTTMGGSSVSLNGPEGIKVSNRYLDLAEMGWCHVWN